MCLTANLAITVVFAAVATHRGAEPPHDPVSIALMTVALIATVLGSGILGLRPPDHQPTM